VLFRSMETFTAQEAPSSFYNPIENVSRPPIAQPAPPSVSILASGSDSALPRKPTAQSAEMSKRLEFIMNNKIGARPKQSKHTIDIALLFDLTGSMQHWFDQAKKKVREIVSTVDEKYPDAELKMAFVGYRDYTDLGTSLYEIMDFGTAEQLKSFMETNVGLCEGGFDAAEDVMGGLDKVLKLTWTGRTRLIIFIADAPGHGQEFHDMGMQHDRYINCEDPGGFKATDLKEKIAVLCNKNIDIHFFHLMDVTLKMERLFDTLLSKYKCKLYVWKLDQDVDQFLPNVIQSIDSSVMRSNWG